jgi:DNA-binding response OmpR family regulator
MLEQNGFKVDSFNDASVALANFKTGIYVLVILDVVMQRMTAANDVYYETLTLYCG